MTSRPWRLSATKTTRIIYPLGVAERQPVVNSRAASGSARRTHTCGVLWSNAEQPAAQHVTTITHSFICVERALVGFTTACSVPLQYLLHRSRQVSGLFISHRPCRSSCNRLSCTRGELDTSRTKGSVASRRAGSGWSRYSRRPGRILLRAVRNTKRTGQCTGTPYVQSTVH
jgi:hypothetical protein